MATIKVYLKTGDVFEYDCPESSVREHMSKIFETGYRSCHENELVWYGAHYIDKIKATGTFDTSYPDKKGGT